MADLKGNVTHDDQHQEILELLPWYLNGTLESEEHKKIELHLQSCSSCRHELEEYEGLQGLLLDDELDLSEIYLEDTMEIIRSKSNRVAQPEPAPSRKPYYDVDEPPKRRGFVLRPRLAFSFGVLLIAFLVAGIFLGNYLGKQEIIADDPLPTANPGTVNQQQEESPFSESGGRRFLTREIVDQGSFSTYLGNAKQSDEDFFLTREEDGRFILDSDIKDARFAGNTGSQRLLLDENFRPESYNMTGSVVYQAHRVDAAIEADHALYTLSRIDGVQTRRVELREFPVMWDYSAFSHFVTIHRAILNEVENGVPLDEIVFSSLTPQILDIQEMRVVGADEVTLTSPDGDVEAIKYSLEAGNSAEPFKMELYSRVTDDTLIAVYMPKQAGLGTTQGLFSYRSDIYPSGLNQPAE